MKFKKGGPISLSEVKWIVGAPTTGKTEAVRVVNALAQRHKLDYAFVDTDDLLFSRMDGSVFKSKPWLPGASQDLKRLWNYYCDSHAVTASEIYLGRKVDLFRKGEKVEIRVMTNLHSGYDAKLKTVFISRSAQSTAEYLNMRDQRNVENGDLTRIGWSRAANLSLARSWARSYDRLGSRFEHHIELEDDEFVLDLFGLDPELIYATRMNLTMSTPGTSIISTLNGKLDCWSNRQRGGDHE